MKIVKNIIDDAIEYNKHIARFNSKKEVIDLEPIKEEKVITITLEEYKELLVYKGKYLGITGINGTTKYDVVFKEDILDILKEITEIK